MKKYINLNITEYMVKNCQDQIDELKKLLSVIGSEVKIDENQGGYWMTIQYEPDEVKKIKTRNAGRRPKSATGLPYLQDIEDRLAAGEKAEDIAESLGLSRSTFYRKLKLARDNYAEYFDFV